MPWPGGGHGERSPFSGGTLTHLSRRALGATAVLTATLLATAPPRPGRVVDVPRPGETHRQDADQHRLRRRGQHRRPRGVGRRAAGPEAGRQRHRRGRRRRRDPRRDRALQLGHRWWRLLRPLRREDRPDRHHRRSRDRAGVDAARRVHRPVDRSALQLHPRAGHQRRLGRRARHPGHLADGPRPLGHDVARSDLPAGDPGRPARLRGRPDVPPADAGEQGPLRRLHLDPAPVPAGRGRAAVGSIFRNPDLARHLPAHRASRHRAPSTAAASARQIVRVVHHPPKTATTTLPVPTGFLEPVDLAAYRTIGRRPTHVGYRGLRRLRHGAVVVTAARPSARR